MKSVGLYYLCDCELSCFKPTECVVSTTLRYHIEDEIPEEKWDKKKRKLEIGDAHSILYN